MRAAIVLFALAACSADEEAAPAKRVELPGTLWYMHGSTLMRYAHGTTTTMAHDIYPSANALPDGRIVAIASRGDGESGEQLALISPAGRITRLGPIAAQVRDPAVAAHSVVVAMTIEGQSDLYRVALDGSTTRLTDDAAGNYHPVIASGAVNQLVFVSSRDGDSEIYKSDLAGVNSSPTTITSAGNSSPTTINAAHTSSFEEAARRLTMVPKDEFDPVVSPDGQTIVFSSDREGAARLFVMASDGSDVRRVTDRASTDDTDESDAVFSRDGSMLAYVAGGHVFVRGQDATGQLVERDLGAGSSATFSPDGNWMAVTRPDGGLVAISLGGGDPIPVARAAQFSRWF